MNRVAIYFGKVNFYNRMKMGIKKEEIRELR